ncbi:uncharacterized protein LOC102810344 [Saccoglossus kowalevskii]|uniref:Uncharacterized protein LOC102810344 n=1 Tax=Saccoglossus kowalevskii TaxID=10224 RepID=A0ABM0M1E9_SACKO|nr:PREDICTED: uncharacterized protein LOC102810344 [Saccoglossus kowalevskii]
METIVTEIESAINDRPLTHLSTDDNDLNPLTPSHLVNGRNICCLPRQTVINPNSNFATDHQSANWRYAYLTTLLTAFWKRWANEYIVSLRERHLNQHRGVKINTVRVGDIVLIHNDVRKRVHWRMGRVTKLLPGADGIVRAVELATKNGSTNRSITRLIPLELSTESETESHLTRDLMISKPNMNIDQRDEQAGRRSHTSSPAGDGDQRPHASSSNGSGGGSHYPKTLK